MVYVGNNFYHLSSMLLPKYKATVTLGIPVWSTIPGITIFIRMFKIKILSKFVTNLQIL